MVVLLVVARVGMGRLRKRAGGPSVGLTLLAPAMYLVALALPPAAIFVLSRQVCVVRSGGERDVYEASLLLGSTTVDTGTGRAATVSSFSYPPGMRSAIVNASKTAQELRVVNYSPVSWGVGGTEVVMSIAPGEMAYWKEALPTIDLGGSPATIKGQPGIATRHELAPPQPTAH